MIKRADKFDQDSSKKVYRKAFSFSKSFAYQAKMSKSPNRQASLKRLAECTLPSDQDNQQTVKVVIEQSKYHNQLYRKLEQDDIERRSSFQKKRSQKNKLVHSNSIELKKKKEKSAEKFNKHIQKVYKKHEQMEINKKEEKNQQAVKLRKQQLQYYSKSRDRKRQMDVSQIKVGTCYRGALEKIDKIHEKNQNYAQASEMIYEKRMARNNSKFLYVSSRSSLTSSQNMKKSIVYDRKKQLSKDKQKHFIQVYGKDLDHSAKAYDHKECSYQKTKQRIQKFFQKRMEKWKNLKQRVEYEKQEVPEKCINILDKTNKAKRKQTLSPFKNSSKEWNNRVRLNRTIMHEKNQQAKDKIVVNHLDLRFTNRTTSTINQRMSALRHQAKKLASEFN